MTQHAPRVNHRFSSLDINRFGLWLFLVSDASFFIALLSARFFVVGTSRPEEVNQVLGLGLTILLLLSSLSAYRAEAASDHGDRQTAQRLLLTTMGMGVIFLFGVGFEWYEAFQYFPPSTAYGTVLFTLTGVHAFHVMTGVLALGFVYFRMRSAPAGVDGSDSRWEVEGAVKWWHFVDVAWVFIYPTLYLVG